MLVISAPVTQRFSEKPRYSQLPKQGLQCAMAPILEVMPAVCADPILHQQATDEAQWKEEDGKHNTARRVFLANNTNLESHNTDIGVTSQSHSRRVHSSFNLF